MRIRQPAISVRTAGLILAVLLPTAGLASLSGCVVHERERVVQPKREVVVEKPVVVEKERTVIERR